MAINSQQITEPPYFSMHVATAQRFYRNLVPDDVGELAVVAGGRELSSEGYGINRETFPYFSIEFVAGGRGTLKLAGETHVLRAGIVFAYGPGVAQIIDASESEPLEKYFVNFTGSAAEAMLTEHELLGRVYQLENPAEVLRTFEEITTYGLRNTPHTGAIGDALLRLLILKIVDGALSPGEAQSPAFATYQRCRHEMNNRYLELTSLGDICEVCHVDRAYLCRLFKRFDQDSPYQYLLRLRMNYAAQLMLQPGTLVKEVADRMGFEDQFHFSRTFKKVLGVSPVSFSKTHAYRRR